MGEIRLNIETFICPTIAIVIYAVADLDASIRKEAGAKLAAVLNSHVEVVIALTAGLDTAYALHAIRRGVGEDTDIATGTTIVDVRGELKGFIDRSVAIIVEAVTECFGPLFVGCRERACPFTC